MESDLSLLEIAGEDDSLLPPVTTRDHTTATTKSATTYFSCSPLQIPKFKRSASPSHPSPTKGLKDNLDKTKSSSSPRGSSNKENINMNKSEVPKLSVELRQMKRRKKGGGYNLRKSLAWDRAFLTEEGVLNPLELSMLSGNFGNSSGEVLSVINEEGRRSLSGDSNYASDSVHLQSLEENLFKEIPATALNVDRGKGGRSLLKHDSSAQDNVASTFLATPKKLSDLTSRMGSKGSVCPRPFASSSLKRPANSNTTKCALKESKLPKLPVPKPPKVPVPKPGSTSLLTATKSIALGASHLKHNQMAQSANNAQKNSGVKGDSKKIRSASNKAKSSSGCISLSAKSIPQHPRRIAVNSPLEINSSTNPRPLLVGKTNGSLQVNTDPVLPPSGVHALEGHDVSRKTGVSSQIAQSIGGNMQFTKFQTKPSGLRMPSPSLGFFGQPKISDSQSLPHRTTQPCNLPRSCIPSLKKFGASNYMPELRPLHAPGKMPKVINDANASENNRVLALSAECSVPSAFNDASCENKKLNLEEDNVQMVEIKVPCDLRSSELIKNSEKVLKLGKVFEKHAKPDRIEHFFYKGDKELQLNDNELLLQSGSCDQFRKDSNEKETTVCPEYGDSNGSTLENPKFIPQDKFSHVKGISGTNDTVEHRHIEDKEYSNSAKKHEIIESASGSATSDIEQNSLIMQHDSLANTHVHGQTVEPAELINPSTGEADRTSHGENNSLKTNDCILLEETKVCERSWKYDSGDIADVNPNLRASSGSEIESFNSPFPHESTEQANEGAAGVYNFTKKFQEPVQILDGNLIVESCSSNLNMTARHNPYFIVDDAYEKSREHLKLQSPCLVVEQVPHFSQMLHLVDHSMVAENSLSEESQEENACRSVSCNVQERSDDSGSQPKVSNALITPEPGAMQDNGIDQNQMVQLPHVKEALSSPVEEAPSVDNCDNSLDMQFRDDIKLSGEAMVEYDISLKMGRDHTIGLATSNSTTFCSIGKELGSHVSSVQTSLNGTILEGVGVNGLTNNIVLEEVDAEISSDNPDEENQNIKANNCILFEETKYFEESQSGDFKNTAEVSPIAQCFTGSELRNSHCQLKDIVHSNEGAAGVDNMASKLHMGDVEAYFLDGNLHVGSCNSSHSTSLETSQYVIEVDDVNEQSGEQPEPQNPCPVDAFVYCDNHALSLDDCLLFGNISSLAETQEENFLDNAKYVVPEQSEANGRELKNSSVFPTVTPAIQYGVAGVEKMSEHQHQHQHPHLEDALVGSVQIKPLAENHNYVFSDTQFRQDMELFGEATSSEFDLALNMTKDQITGSVTSENIIAPVGELRYYLGNFVCFTGDDKATKPVRKSDNGTKQDKHLMIKPLVTAVPFSDEWLAAMEAAGEDILTMKSGAVQNSPPDKSVPERGPWSPVKRKNNQVGPFDCTKFTNIPPL